MSTIIGRFYFKRTSNGNLLGEFSNNEAGVSTESADRIGETDINSFIGEYRASWQEKGKSIYAKLSITSDKSLPKGVFKIEWFVDGNLKFKGEGMLCDDILIGNYIDL